MSPDNVVAFHGFETPGDDAAARAVGARIGAAWRCQIHYFGRFNPIDCYAERAGRMVALIEIKCRSHASADYPTVFLSVRKHFCLTLGSYLYSVPSYFVVGFVDRIGWCAIGDVNAQHFVGGHNFERAKNDREPLLDVPTKLLRWIT